MKDFDKNDLFDSTRRSGFKLEYDTYRKLDNLLRSSFCDEMHHLYLNHSIGYPDEGTESFKVLEISDVYASCVINQKLYSLIIECKGTSSENKLVLIQDVRDQSFQQIVSPVMNLDGTWSDNHGNDHIESNNEKGPVLTYSGDFFEQKNDGCFKRANLQDERNLLYKGVRQLASTVYAEKVHQSDYETGAIIVPLLVTNAEIWVVSYFENQIYNVPWALYDVVFKHDSFVDDSVSNLPYVIICNVDKLDDCLKAKSYQYHLNWKKGCHDISIAT